MKKLIMTILSSFFLFTLAHAEMITKEFSVEGRPSLTLSNISGNITIMQGNDSEVIIHADNPNPEVEVIFEQHGNEITVETKYPRHSRNIRKGVTFEVWLPNSSNADINTVSGNIKMEDIEGRLSLNSVSGDITLKNSAGNLDLNSVSGDILAKGLGSSDMDANSVSGDIELYDLSLETGNFDLNNVSGDIAVWHSESASYTITGQSISGDMITNGIDNIRVKKAKYSGMKSLNGSFNGGGAEIEVNSVSGDILIGIK